MDTYAFTPRRPRALALAGLSVAALSAFSGCGGDAASSTSSDDAASPPPSAAGKVDISNYKFGPETITVSTGSPVAFTNEDAASHTATATDMSFDTDTLGEGQSKSLTFDHPGTFTYFCRFHPFMKGTVVVK
jgi:plastocyanin